MRSLLFRLAFACGLTPVAGFAQQGEIYIEGVDPVGVDPLPPLNSIAACLLTPTADNCHGLKIGVNGGANANAATPIVNETFIVDPDENAVTVAKAPLSTAAGRDDSKPEDTSKLVLTAVGVTINFNFDSDRIRPDQGPIISNLIAAMKEPELSDSAFAVIGHTDSSGSAAYNCALSERRAAAVAQALQAGAVDVPLYPLGWGEHALADKANPDAAKNRRVTFLLLPDAPEVLLNTAKAICMN